MTFSPPIAAIWTPKRVIAAAGNKIEAAGDVFFALAGLSACGDTGFDAAQLIKEALPPEGAYKKRLEALVEAVEAPLAGAAQFVHDNKPEEFKKFLAGRDALAAIVFCRRGDELCLSLLGFRTKKRGKDVVLALQQKDYPNPATSMMSVEFVLAGAGGGVEAAFLKETTAQKALVHPEQSLQRFMDLAIAADSGRFGYPIYVVKLADSGAAHTTIEKP